MKRRNFIKQASIISGAAPILINGMKLRAIPESRLFELISYNNDNILVLIQLQGGNDGLSTVVPLEYYDQLAPQRSNVIIAENKLLKINDQNAFHPALEGMKNLYDNAKLNIVHSVGYPNQNRSHFRSTDIWTSGSAADEFDSTGWMGKYFDTQYNGFPVGFPNEANPHPIAISMSARTSETCQGIASNYSMGIQDPFALGELDQSFGGTPPDNIYGDELAFIRNLIVQTNEYSEVVVEAAKAGNSIANYPEGNDLAKQLKNVAYLISGGLDTKIYVCTIGGFDTHADQVMDGNAEGGVHANLLSQVSSAIAAFQNDLETLGLEKKVVGMTFSEFGRQIASNSSLGTDHGTAAPLFVFGSCVKPGFTGLNPVIPVQAAGREGVEMQIDFRDVYGTLLEDWFDIPEDDVKNLLYQDYQKLNLISGCESTSTIDIEENLDVEVYPNPFSSHINVRFASVAGHARLSILDVRGVEITVVFSRRIQEGNHDFQINTSNLVSGNYFVRLITDSDQEVWKLVKIK